jgi:hypothetical protein
VTAPNRSAVTSRKFGGSTRGGPGAVLEPDSSQSSFIPVCLTTFVHVGVSALIRTENSSGVFPTTSLPSSCRRLRNLRPRPEINES